MTTNNKIKQKILDNEKSKGIKVQSVTLPDDFSEENRNEESFLKWAKETIKSRYLNSFKNLK